MTRLAFSSSDPAAGRAALGLVVLQTDETIEPEFQRLLRGREVALYTTRIPSARTVTPETLKAMEAALPAAAGLLPAALEFDAIGYACTSGATLIGPEAVARLIREATHARAVSNPLSAVIAACEALAVRRLGFVTPYQAEVSAAMRKTLEAHGLEITAFGSFEEENDSAVARIDPASILDAALTVGGTPDTDAVFLSCTNLRTLDMIAPAEARLEKPVITSNQALAWHMLGLAGVSGPGDGAEFGRLMG